MLNEDNVDLKECLSREHSIVKTMSRSYSFNPRFQLHSTIKSTNFPYSGHSPAKSSSRRITMQSILSRTPTQTLSIPRLNTKFRTNFLHIPSLRSSSASRRAPTHRETVIAYNTNIANRVNDVHVCICISFLELIILTNFRVGASRKIASSRRAYGTGATVQTWGTGELAVYQRGCDALFIATEGKRRGQYIYTESVSSVSIWSI